MITKLGADTLRQKDSANKAENYGHLLTGLGGAGVLAVSTKKALPLIENDYGKFTPQEASRIRRMMGADTKVKESGRPVPGAGPMYDPIGHRVHADRTGFSYAHELGHATSRISPRKHKGIRLGHAVLTTGVNNLSPVINIATTLGARTSRDETVQNVLGAMDTATKAATVANLAEEAQASIRALRAINKIKGRAAALQAARLYLPAFGTYLGYAGISHGLVPWLTNKAYDMTGG